MQLRDANDTVVSDAGSRGGEPVIRGTRIPVYLIHDLVIPGAGAKEILEDYPALAADNVRAAVAYVQTHPKRGGPREAPWKTEVKVASER